MATTKTMPFEVPDDRLKSLEKLVYELETSKLPIRRHAAELLAYRDLVAACRQAKRLPPNVYRALQRIPRLSDKEAWDRLTAAERQEAGLDVEERKPA